MIEILKTKPEFQSLTQDAVLAAILTDQNQLNPIALEVMRLASAYTQKLQHHITRLARLPPHTLHIKSRCPIEAVALQLTSEIIRETIPQPEAEASSDQGEAYLGI